jgi:hypothetical protein
MTAKKTPATPAPVNHRIPEADGLPDPNCPLCMKQLKHTEKEHQKVRQATIRANQVAEDIKEKQRRETRLKYTREAQEHGKG